MSETNFPEYFTTLFHTSCIDDSVKKVGPKYVGLSKKSNGASYLVLEKIEDAHHHERIGKGELVYTYQIVEIVRVDQGFVATKTTRYTEPVNGIPAIRNERTLSPAKTNLSEMHDRSLIDDNSKTRPYPAPADEFATSIAAVRTYVVKSRGSDIGCSPPHS